MKDLKECYLKELDAINNLNDLNDLKVKYLGKKGLITELTKNMSELSIEEKKEVGRVSNELKNDLNERINTLETKLREEELNKKLEREKIDVTLPGTKIENGAPNILEKVVEDFEELFMSMGYDVVDGPEIELDKFNFELLNIPKGHPARDAQDTFYIEDNEILLRSHTSPVQARVMTANGG